MLSATIQRGGRVDSLLAGVLATFILSSVNLIIMGRPNIGFINTANARVICFAAVKWPAGYSQAPMPFSFARWSSSYYAPKLAWPCVLFGDNPSLFQRLGKDLELHRLLGFAITNMLAAAAGCLTAQTIGYADVGMGLGMTLTGIGAIILGQQLLSRFYRKKHLRLGGEFIACLIGVVFYYFVLNLLLRLDIDPTYLKLMLGLLLIIFLRVAVKPVQRSVT